MTFKSMPRKEKRESNIPSSYYQNGEEVMQPHKWPSTTFQKKLVGKVAASTRSLIGVLEKGLRARKHETFDD